MYICICGNIALGATFQKLCGHTFFLYGALARFRDVKSSLRFFQPFLLFATAL